MCDNHYVNIVENSTEDAPIELGTPLDPNLDRDTLEKILKHHENHPTIIGIKKQAKTYESLAFPKAKTEDINKIINLLTPPKKLLDLMVNLLIN